ncbi:histone deacetylase 8-like [Argonauta hians]
MANVGSNDDVVVDNKTTPTETPTTSDTEKYNEDSTKALKDCNNQSNLPKPSNSLPKVAYIFNDNLLQWSNFGIKVRQRGKLVHALIEAYGLTELMRVVSPSRATFDEMSQFHCHSYLQFLESINNSEDEEKYSEEAEQYGLSYDCPTEKGIFDYVSYIAGSTISAARCLVDKENPCQIAINWFGGWHHAHRDSASGFCYVNDCVLGILELRKTFDRVLYVDLDLHHGDGVEEAFSVTSKVFTVSFHKLLPGFFPGSGSLEDVGFGKGIHHCVNVPLKDGIKDAEFVALFKRIMNEVIRVFSPQAIVCQCGADGIAGDPMNSFNLTSLSLASCVRYFANLKLPLLLLGGGGYNFCNTSKTWTLITATALGKKLPDNIPDHKYYITYGPSYEIGVDAGNRKDMNSYESIRNIYRRVVENLSQLKTK